MCSSMEKKDICTREGKPSLRHAHRAQQSWNKWQSLVTWQFMHRANKKEKKRSWYKHIYQRLISCSRMEMNANEYHNPNFHSSDYTLWSSSSWQQFQKSGFPRSQAGTCFSLLSPAFRPFFAHHHLAKLSTHQNCPFEIKGAETRSQAVQFQPGGKNSLRSTLLSKATTSCGWEPTPLPLPCACWSSNSWLSIFPRDEASSPRCCQHKPGWLLTPSPASSASNQLLAFFFLIFLMHLFLQCILQRVEVPKPSSLQGTSLPSPCHLALCHLQAFCKNHWSCSFYSLCCSFFIKYTSPWKSHLL